MRILITGSSGYLGQHLLHHMMSNTDKLFPDQDLEIISAFGSLSSFGDSPWSQNSDTRKISVAKVGNVNVAASSSVSPLLQSNPPDILIHLAAISSLAECESNPSNTMAVNCPTSTLLAHLPPHCKIIFLSTDQVYDGLNAPYKEDEEEGANENPVNTYGASKLAFERSLLTDDAYKNRSVCLRSSLILGPKTPGECRKQSFLQFVHEALTNKVPTTIFSDEYRSAIFLHDVIKLILWFATNGVDKYSGVYNMGGPERVSRWDIAKMVAASCDLDMSHMSPVERASLPPGNVNSPPDISMDITKLCSVTGLQMTPLRELVKLSLF